MNESSTRALAAAARLRDALERTAGALASPDLDALLACESAIEGALADIPPFAGLPAEDRRAIRLELDRARATLLRCRRLGAGLREFVRLSFEAQGRGTGYGRPEPRYAGLALNTRV